MFYDFKANIYRVCSSLEYEVGAQAVTPGVSAQGLYTIETFVGLKMPKTDKFGVFVMFEVPSCKFSRIMYLQ